MREPTLEERKSIWLWCYASESFDKVIKACDFLSGTPPAISKSTVEVLVSGIIVTYAKPFTHGRGVGKLEATKVVPLAFKKTHELLMDLRHKTIAHLDGEDFRADDPAFGNIHQVRV